MGKKSKRPSHSNPPAAGPSSPRKGKDLLQRLGSSAWSGWALSPAEQEAVAAMEAVVFDSMQQGDVATLQAVISAQQHGTQLFVQQHMDVSDLSSNSQQLLMLCHLWRGFFVGVAGLYEMRAMPEQQARAVGVQVAVQVARTGLLSTVDAACSCLARAINMHAAVVQQLAVDQQQAGGEQQAGQAHRTALQVLLLLQDSSAAPLAGILLASLAQLGHIWPGGRRMFSPAIAAVVPAAADLALAVLRNPAAHDNPTCLDRQQDAPVWAALDFGSGIITSYGALPQSDRSQVPEQISTSSSVGQLLLLQLAFVTQQVHKMQQQEQELLLVPPYHEQLLQALGLRSEVVPPVQVDATVEADPYGASMDVILRVLAARDDISSVLNNVSSDSSSSTNTVVPRVQDEQQQQAAIRVRVTMLLVECMALRPTPDSITCGAGVLLKAIDQQPPAAADDEISVEVLSVLLQLLPPAIQRAAERVAAEQDSDSAHTAATAWIALGSAVLGLTAKARLGTTAPVFLQQPTAYSSLLEAALRGPMEVASSTTVSYCLDSIVSMAESQNAISTALWTAGSRQAVFSLLISLVKGMQCGIASSSRTQFIFMRVVLYTEALPMPVATSIINSVMGSCSSSDGSDSDSDSSDGSTTSSSSDSSSRANTANSSGATASAVAAAAGTGSTVDRLLLVALARCLVVAGMALQQLQQAAGTSRESVIFIPNYALCLGNSSAAVAAPGSAVPRIAAAEPAVFTEPVLQQLMQQQAQLLQGLQQARSAVTEPAAAAGVDALAASELVGELGQQLEAFGAAVAAQLAVMECCNWHRCTNTAKGSELELVGGKSCVCGGCRVARYCSRACQVAHYKDWHKPLCRRIKQQQQEESAVHVHR